MLIVWKNKGLLVLFYPIVSLLAIAVPLGVLSRNYGGIFRKIDFYSGMGLIFLLAAILTYSFKDDYYIDKEGNKKKMDTVNELFWMKMEIWAYIYLAISLILLGNLIFKYFDPVE